MLKNFPGSRNIKKFFNMLQNLKERMSQSYFVQFLLKLWSKITLSKQFLTLPNLKPF